MYAKERRILNDLTLNLEALPKCRVFYYIVIKVMKITNFNHLFYIILTPYLDE